MLFLDAAPVYTRIVERMRWLPEQDDEPPQPGDLPAREQRLLLMRLAALFGPDAIAHAPRARAPRSRRRGARRGRPAGADARGRRDRPAARRRRARPASPRASTKSRRWSIPAMQSRIGRAARPRLDVEDGRSQRHRLPADRAGQGGAGEARRARSRSRTATTGRSRVVRRMQRQQVDEVTVGVEIIARRLVRVLLRSWVAPSDVGRAGAPTGRSSASTCRRTRTTGRRRSAA